MAAGDTQITIAGNLVEDPELRFTPAGQPVARFRVASTPRFRDNASGEWKDGDSLFLTCNVWRQAAENVAETLQQKFDASDTYLENAEKFMDKRARDIMTNKDIGAIVEDSFVNPKAAVSTPSSTETHGQRTAAGALLPREVAKGDSDTRLRHSVTTRR